MWRARSGAGGLAGTLLGAAVVIVLAGCGSGAGAATARPTSSADVLAVWQRYALCARAHGVPTLPDPAFAADGRITFPGFTAKASLEGVQAACASILHSLPPNPSTSGGPPSDIAGLLRFAQCMRTHAFPDWPDPKSDGTFPASGLPPMKTPALISAMTACDHLNPDKAGHVYGS